MRWLSLAIGLALPGCDQVFQLERPPLPIDGPPPELRVVIDYQLLRALPDLTIESERVEMPTPKVRLDDDTAPAITAEPDGTYTFSRSAPDQRYSVVLKTSAGSSVEYQLDTARLTAVERTIGRADAAALMPFTYVTQYLPNAGVTVGEAVLMTTGQWSETAGAPASASSIHWNTVRTLGPPSGLLSSMKGDRVYGTFHGRRTTTGAGGEYTVLTDLCEDPPPIEAVGSISLTCTLAPAPASECAHVATDYVIEDARLRSALVDGPAYFIVIASWELIAVPAAELTRMAGLRLAYQASGAGQMGFDGPIQYAAPFAGHTQALGSKIERTRYVQLGALSAYPVTAALRQYMTPTAACGAPTVIGGFVAIPTGFALDGTPLLQSSTVAIDRSRDPQLTWTLVQPGSADYFVVRLAELTDGGGFTLPQIRQVYVTTRQSVVIDRELLEPGKTYLFEVEALLGYPAAATGDLRTVAGAEAPQATANTFSGVFMVTQ